MYGRKLCLAPKSGGLHRHQSQAAFLQPGDKAVHYIGSEALHGHSLFAVSHSDTLYCDNLLLWKIVNVRIIGLWLERRIEGLCQEADRLGEFRLGQLIGSIGSALDD